MSFHTDIKIARELAEQGYYQDAEVYLRERYPNGFFGRSIDGYLMDMYEELSISAKTKYSKRYINEANAVTEEVKTLAEEWDLLEGNESEHLELTIEDETPTSEIPENSSAFFYKEMNLLLDESTTLIGDIDLLDAIDITDDLDEELLPEIALSKAEFEKIQQSNRIKNYEDSYYFYDEYYDDADNEDTSLDDFDSIDDDVYHALEEVGYALSFEAVANTCERSKTNKIDRTSKARETAATLIYDHDLSNRYEKPLTYILLLKNCHHRTIYQLKRLFFINASPEELVVALKIRAEWEYHGLDYCDGASFQSEKAPGAQISWISAVLLSRMLRTNDVDAIMSFVCDKHSEWRSRDSQYLHSPNFNYYISFLVTEFQRQVECHGDMLPVVDGFHDDQSDNDDYIGSRKWNHLNDLGLLIDQTRIFSTFRSNKRSFPTQQEDE